jgi:hypothetical protein
MGQGWPLPFYHPLQENAAMAIVIGKFTLEGNDINGPASYIEQRGFALIDTIQEGKDTTFNLTCHLSPSVQVAVLVRLQTDYAGWLGQQELLRRLK